MNQQRLTFCTNCGRPGHQMRQCLEPVISIGIIAYKIEKSKIKVIMIQRRNSLSYVEFLRGRYNPSDQAYILMLLNGMTEEEINYLRTTTFDILWSNLWINNVNKHFKSDYISSKNKFEKIDIESLSSKVSDYYETPEWGFPKGRRNYKEQDIDCAKREFSEETGLDKNDIYLINNVIPVREDFLGTNNVRYRHIYYLAKIRETAKNKELAIDLDNLSQIAEIGDIEWLDNEECLLKIRETEKYRKNTVNNVFDFLKKLNNNFYLKKFN
jgi:ADP-ribose pyrophosphatase YjhB (NUDIX family)